MTRIEQMSNESAHSPLKEMYATLEKNLGRIPNIFLTMGQSPATLKAYFDLTNAMNQTSFDKQTKEEIALAVSQANACHYCLAAHTAIAKAIGIDEAAISDSRSGHSDDPKKQAILTFVKSIVNKKGLVAKEELDALKKIGLSDQQLVEIFLIVMQITFTNYFNHIFDPTLDFPVAPELKNKE